MKRGRKPSKPKSPRAAALDKAVELFRRGKVKGTIRKLHRFGISALEFANRLDHLRDANSRTRPLRNLPSLEEAIRKFKDVNKIAALSDLGAADRRLVLEIDGEQEETLTVGEYGLTDAELCEQLHRANQLLVDTGNEGLIPILRLIVRNKSNRRESIVHLARTTNMKFHCAKVKYFLGRSILLKLFSVNKIKGETKA